MRHMKTINSHIIKEMEYSKYNQKSFLLRIVTYICSANQNATYRFEG